MASLETATNPCTCGHPALLHLERKITALDSSYHLPPKPRAFQNKLLRQQGILATQIRTAVELWFTEINREYLRALKHLRIEKIATSDILIDTFDWELIEEEGRMVLYPAELRAYVTAGTKALQFAGLEAAFNINNPWYERSARAVTAKLVTDVSRSMQRNIRDSIVMALQEGVSVDVMARRLRPGLQALPVSINRINREALEKIRAGIPQIRVDSWAARESARMRNYRAFMIARTESSRAMNQGALYSYQDAGLRQVEFYANFGACEICQSLHGQRYTVAEASGVIPVHPNGRCTFLPVIGSANIFAH